MLKPEVIDAVKSYVAIGTGVAAFVISIATLGWTIYRDALRKPRFGLSVSVSRLIVTGQPRTPSFVSLDIVNHGPGANRIQATMVRRGWYKRTISHRSIGLAFVSPDHAHPASQYKGERLEAGDVARFVFPFAAATGVGAPYFLMERFVQIGVVDSFGRSHWAPARMYRAVQEAFDRQVNAPFAKDAPDQLSID